MRLYGKSSSQGILSTVIYNVPDENHKAVHEFSWQEDVAPDNEGFN